jgi:hypothetical protein
VYGVKKGSKIRLIVANFISFMHKLNQNVDRCSPTGPRDKETGLGEIRTQPPHDVNEPMPFCSALQIKLTKYLLTHEYSASMDTMPDIYQF